MANNRAYLRCRTCGKGFFIGKGFGGRGYIVDDTLTEEDIDNIFNKKPEFKAQKFGVAPIWHRVLGGKL